MHGMRWKVNSDTETQERGETKGGWVLWDCVISQMKDFSSSSALFSAAALSWFGLHSSDRDAARVGGRLDWYSTNWPEPANQSSQTHTHTTSSALRPPLHSIKQSTTPE